MQKFANQHWKAPKLLDQSKSKKGKNNIAHQIGYDRFKGKL